MFVWNKSLKDEEDAPLSVFKSFFKSYPKSHVKFKIPILLFPLLRTASVATDLLRRSLTARWLALAACLFFQ